jgi:hypothetical protein
MKKVVVNEWSGIQEKMRSELTVYLKIISLDGLSM